jgi:hypothetical protein
MNAFFATCFTFVLFSLAAHRLWRALEEDIPTDWHSVEWRFVNLAACAFYVACAVTIFASALHNP